MAPSARPRPATCATNATQHPGIPDQKQPRRTRVEVTKAKSVAKKKSDTKEATRLAGEARVAELEDNMALEDEQTKLTATRPVQQKKPVELFANVAAVDKSDDIYGQVPFMRHSCMRHSHCSQNQ
jgi:hypothetical protein